MNTSSVPISVTSHFHFFEVNPRLLFDRAVAYGRHLAIPAGSHVALRRRRARWRSTLVPIGGARVVIGFAGLVDGPLDAPGARGGPAPCAAPAASSIRVTTIPGNPGTAVPAVLDQLRGRTATVAP